MPSYYEVLKLEINASPEAINAAIDERYNEYRRLVNHHDPEIVEQANRALRQLEEIRSTLTNPEKRAVYDQSLSFGGLADPAALLQAASAGTAMITPPSVRLEEQAKAEESPWRCINCGKLNREGSKVCANCQKVLARSCPSCGNVVPLADKYCSNCSANVEEEIAKLKIEFEHAQKAVVDDLRSKISAKRNEMDRLNRYLSSPPIFFIDSDLKELTGQSVETIGCGGLVLIGFLAVIAAGICSGATRSDYGGLIGFLAGAGILFWFMSMRVQERVKTVVEAALVKRQEYISHAEQRLQREQVKQFDPVSPKPYSPD